MNETDLVAFTRGAEWVRADFHLHTIKDPGSSRKFRAEYVGKENAFAKEWIAKLQQEGIRIAVVTNHNYFDRDEYKQLRKLGRNVGILVLPGVELGIKEGAGGIHTLIVFDPDAWVLNDQNDDRIKRFIDSQFVGIPNEGSRTNDDMTGCLEALDKYDHDYFVVFAHVENDNGLFNELQGSNLSHVIEGCGKRWRDRVLGLQKVKRVEVLQSRWPETFSFPASVEGSDPICMAEVGSSERNCYLKIGELTFSSVKFALHDWPHRVLNRASDPNGGPCLHQISFKGGLLDGQVFSFSDELTCLIGSRGSGKSSVVECLRFGLGLESGESDLKYKNALLSGMLTNGGEVSVTGKTAEGSLFEIRRPLGYNPVVRIEGKDTRLRPSDILSGLLYFGQKDLGHRHPGFEDDLFLKLIGRRVPEDRAIEESHIGAVRQAVDAWRSVLRASEKEQEYAMEEERLGHQLAVYREKGVEKQLERLTTFDTDKRNLTEFIDQLEALRSRIHLNSDEWEEVENDWLVLKSEILADCEKAVLRFSNEFAAIHADHTAVVDRVDALLAGLREVLHQVLEKERELQEEFAALQREIDAPGLNLEEFRARKSRHEQLVKLLKAAGNRKEMSVQALSQVEVTARALHDLWREWHRQEIQKLNTKSMLLPSTLRLSIEFEGNREEFRSFLKSKFTGTGFRAASVEKLVETFTNGFAMFQRRQEVADLFGGSADVAKFNSVHLENLSDILTYRVPDKRVIWFKDVQIQELSLGQRATALLQLLMSLDDHPILIVDQPEDDLDNETIFRFVVEPLLERKKRRQFIIATHNPNIPVLGDSEIVHSCREVSKGVYEHRSGSLDSSATRDAIVSIMEGGAQAFEQRQKIYSQWTNSL